MLPTVSFVSEIFAGDSYTDDGLRFATKAEARGRSYGRPTITILSVDESRFLPLT